MPSGGLSRRIAALESQFRYTGNCTCPREPNGTRLAVAQTDDEKAASLARFDACSARHGPSDPPLVVRLLSVAEVTSGRAA